jgi:ElaB/YqjD/DUF883 family membrane-anchored ribosome-binding protein
MDKESDVIKHQMEHTRTQLTDKLELLEHQVADTVTGAAETVEKVRQTVSDTVTGATETVASVKQALEDTVQSVKDTVRETAESVGETLDVRRQVEKHPWAMVCGATAVGFGMGMLCSRVNVPAAVTSSASRVASSARSLAGSMEQQVSGWSEPPPPPPPFGQRSESRQFRRDEPHEESLWMPAVHKLKGLAIGAMFGVLRDVLAKNVPPAISGQLGDVIDNFTTSVGGQPISGKVLPDSWNGGSRRTVLEGEASREQSKREWESSPRPRQTAMADSEE